MTNKKLIGEGPFRYTSISNRKVRYDSYMFVSETCALDIVDAKFIREVENGEIVVIENNDTKKL